MIDLKPACRQMIELLTAVTTDRLTNSTPCSEFTLADLIEHVDEAARAFVAVAGTHDGRPAQGAESGPAVGLADDWRDRVIAHVRSLGQAWDDPAAWRGSAQAAGMELPNELWGRIAFTEIVVHSWDIAQSADLPFDLPEDTLRACLDHVTEFLPNAPLSGLWGPAQPVDPDAPLLDRIVATTGRAPRPRDR